MKSNHYESAIAFNSASFARFHLSFPIALEHKARIRTLNIAHTDPSEVLSGFNSASFARFHLSFPIALEHKARIRTLYIAHTDPSVVRLQSENSDEILTASMPRSLKHLPPASDALLLQT